MKRFGLIAAIALAGAAPTISLAQQVLNLRDADIRAFIQDAARVTGRTFIIDARVAGKVSVVTDRPLSRSEYFEVFLSTLRANGLVAVPTGNGAYRIQPVDGAAAQPGRSTTVASRTGPGGVRPVTARTCSSASTARWRSSVTISPAFGALVSCTV